MCLIQGHNIVTPVRLEPAAPRSRVKHSTREPLCSFSVLVPVHGVLSCVFPNFGLKNKLIKKPFILDTIGHVTLANSENPYKMSHKVAFHQGLH